MDIKGLPWNTGEAGQGYDDYVYDANGNNIASVYPGSARWTSGDAETYARLIAAAPELLEAAKAIYAGVVSARETLEGRVDINASLKAFRNLEAAIAKAEGK